MVVGLKKEGKKMTLSPVSRVVWRYDQGRRGAARAFTPGARSARPRVPRGDQRGSLGVHQPQTGRKMNNKAHHQILRRSRHQPFLVKRNCPGIFTVTHPRFILCPRDCLCLPRSPPFHPPPSANDALTHNTDLRHVAATHTYTIFKASSVPTV